MLQLEPLNLLIKEAFTNAFKQDYQPISLDRIITDFDFTNYHISTPESKDKILFSISIKCWNDLVKYGVLDLLSLKYSNFKNLNLLDQPEIGYDFSMYIDLNIKILNEDEILEIINELSLLKRNCFAAPYLKAFKRYEELAKQSPPDPNNLYGEDSVISSNANEEVLSIDYREYESIYIKPSNDRVTVIFSTIFKDETDKVFSKVFLQEFSDARKRSIQKAPQVINSHSEPPLEIRHLIKPNNYIDENKISYITFVLFPRHLQTEEIQWNTITHIELFRSYFHYHIKIVKCYLHQRMRYRVSGFMKVLNRARRDVDEEESKHERKTATGRRFEIKG
ncbi:hypothetical protein B5S28_g4971 [[Candida] boidinii]|uniref:Unnamed protein product n=1 Tax=Candida boidinii TaxID=5477 RepID=A0ACB5TYE6_CANBO|nr:hypothetical protein B5S28_g4971 [[Candida] boidinii]OWB75569.1 hypothetical protein B5S31_g5487 [[Candida] boidinii]GME97639.1 unnamed protein product [[Candida] boidinii]